MSLKSVFKTMKNEGYVVAPLEKYLLSLVEDNDRAINVNSPSQVGGCLRARYFARLGVKKDGAIEPRTRRIFDNGTHVHLRLQEYLTKQGILLLDEVPVFDKEYKIQGHTDGYVRLSPTEIGILEIKSINTNSFSGLKTAKEEHESQGMTYLYCAEKRRKYLRNTYTTQKSFDASEKKRGKEHALRYDHLRDSSRFTREEKIAHQVKLNLASDAILYSTTKPITRCIFVYEDKNDQNLKEFCIQYDDHKYKAVLDDFQFLNHVVEHYIVPDRCPGGKSSYACRFCDFKIECYN